MNLCFPFLSKQQSFLKTSLNLYYNTFNIFFFFSQDDWRLQEEETQETQAPVSCSHVKPKEGKA